MTSTQRTLAGLLLLQVVLILLFRSPLSGNSGATEAAPLLPQLADFDATRIQFQGKDGETLNVRQEDGTWSIVESHDYPADEGKIQDLLKELGDIEVRRPVVSSDRYHTTFKVTDNDNEGRLQIWGPDDDDPSVDLILGSSANYQLSHVRSKGDDRVFEVRGLAPYDVRASAADWAQKDLIQTSADQIVALSLSNSGGAFEVSKQDGTWQLTAPGTMAGALLDSTLVEDLVRTATTLRIESPAGALDEITQGIGTPVATLTLRFATSENDTNGGMEEVIVRIGNPVPEKETQRFITRSGSNVVASIWESSIQGLIDKTASDLLVSGVESAADSSTQ